MGGIAIVGPELHGICVELAYDPSVCIVIEVVIITVNLHSKAADTPCVREKVKENKQDVFES